MDGGPGFFGSSFRVGRLFGVDLRIHAIFVVWIALALLSPGADPAAVLLANVVLFGSVLLHELGHCFGARRVGGEARDIVLWPLGGLSTIETPRTARAEFLSTGAGPLVNLLLVLIGLGLVALDGGASALVHRVAAGDLGLGLQWERWPGMTALGRVALMVAVWNAFLFLFNVLPAYPMDGGRLLRSVLWPLVGWRRATVAATSTALAFGALFILYGAIATYPFLVLIGVMVLLASWQELQVARMAGGRWNDRSGA
jgi:Zn-dependent protease